MNPSEILAKWLPSIVILDSGAGDVRSWFTFISVLRADHHSQARLSTIFSEEKSFALPPDNLQQYRGIFTKKLLIMFYVNLHSQEMRNDCCWPGLDLITSTPFMLREKKVNDFMLYLGSYSINHALFSLSWKDSFCLNMKRWRWDIRTDVLRLFSTGRVNILFMFEFEKSNKLWTVCGCWVVVVFVVGKFVWISKPKYQMTINSQAAQIKPK